MAVIMAIGLSSSSEAQIADSRTEEPRFISDISVHAELGFLAVLSHRIQLSKSGTYLNYRDNGGQDVLFAVSRFSLDLTLYERHVVTLLYQPLSLETTARFDSDIVIDELLFPAGTPVDLVYRFPFYRASWMYDLFKGKRYELALGLSLQIRNATITFASLDGTLYRDSRGVGLVPLLKLRGRYTFDSGVWIGTEIDGIYAPISYLNGDDNDVTGAFLDANIRSGVPVLFNRGALFLNLRYLGGGAEGTSDDDSGPGDGFVKNWLHFLTVTVGATLELP